MKLGHKENAPISVTISILSISSTRTIENDVSGQYIKDLSIEKSHTVIHHKVVDDDVNDIKKAVIEIISENKCDAILITGGTGITKKDVTIEAIKPLLQKELTSYATVFAVLSYHEVGSSAILSRATAGIIENTAVFCMPGSLKACKLACEQIIFKELGHIKKHLLD
ncbi:MAG: molybdenum cofactor biosynthesis protein MoaB [Deltaproteobacteria bacterium]|nr:molybdenum cofactor biosynthesis protein MoaB [Deltaproteobacteria bacterium]